MNEGYIQDYHVNNGAGKGLHPIRLRSESPSILVMGRLIQEVMSSNTEAKQNRYTSSLHALLR